MRSNGVHGGAAVRALSHQLDVGLLAQQSDKALACDGLVVYDQRADWRSRHAVATSISCPGGLPSAGT